MLPSIGKIFQSPTPPEIVLPRGGQLFQAGEIFRGTVLKRFSPGEVLIQAKGKEFTAKTDLRLQPGASYHFQVIRGGQKSELRVLEGLPRDLKHLQEMWSAGRLESQKMGELLNSLSRFSNLEKMPAHVAKALSNLHHLLPMLVCNGGDTLKADWLARFLLVSGLFWESKLAKAFAADGKGPQRGPLLEDLKGCLLRLKQSLAAATGKVEGMDGLREKIEQALKMIEQEQWLNLALSRNGLGCYWSMPGAGEDVFQRAEILVDQEAGEGVIRFCLLADFSRLGPVLAELSLAESNLDVAFLVESRKIRKFVVAHLDELRESLQEIGFTPGRFSCRTEKEIEPYMARLVEQRAAERAIHLVI